MMSDENQQSVLENAPEEPKLEESKPEEEDFSKLLEENDQALEKKSFEKGMIVEGVIVQIGAEFAYVNIGAKAEASLAVSELLNPEDGKLTHVVGDQGQDHRTRRERHQAFAIAQGREHCAGGGLPVRVRCQGARQGDEQGRLRARGHGAACILPALADSEGQG